MTTRHPRGNRMATRVAATMLLVLLGGCATAHEPAPPPKRPMPGADRDIHGCIPSAGYTWCAATRRCERPWELARERGFDNTAEAFGRFCEAGATEPVKPVASG